MANRVGQILGKYKLVAPIGKGGYAEVYQGVHIHLGVSAAIKVLKSFDTNDNVETFRKEARIVAELEHPNIIRVRDFDIEEGTPFLVMDYAQKGSLKDFLPPNRALPYVTVVSYIKQVASALQYAHDRKNLIHRDVKPHNMLIMNDDRIVLSDFGIALIAQSGQHEAVGTASYIAPEQIEGRPDIASDQYALGIVAYEWLSGDLPFQGTLMEIYSQHLNAQPPSLKGKVHASVEQVILRALAKNPGDRFARVQDFADALESTYQRVAQEAQSTTRPIPWEKVAITIPLGDPDASTTGFLPGPLVPPMVSAGVMISHYDDLFKDFHILNMAYQNKLHDIQRLFEQEKIEVETALAKAQTQTVDGVKRVRESIEKTKEKLASSEWSFIIHDKVFPPTSSTPISLEDMNIYQMNALETSRKISSAIKGYAKRKKDYPSFITLIGTVGGVIVLFCLLYAFIDWLVHFLGVQWLPLSVTLMTIIIGIFLSLILITAIFWVRDYIVTSRLITTSYPLFLQVSSAVESAIPRQNEALQNTRNNKIANLQDRYRRSRERVEQQLQASLSQFTPRLTRSMKEDGLLVAKWDDPQWQQWRPRQQAIPLARLGVMSEDDKFPPLPALTICPGGDNILFKTPGSVKERAIQALQSLMLRLLVAQSPGKLRFTLIDPTGMGENVATFLKLADYDKELISSKAWTKKDQIAQQLSVLSDHMENVIQQYLRNQFPTIDDYNKVAGEIAEPYRILVVVGFPANFTKETANQLTHIATAGPRCGVYVLMTVDTGQSLTGFKVAELERVAKVISWNGQHFTWNHKDVGECKIDLDMLPRAAVFGQLLTRIGEQALEAHQHVEIPFKRLMRHVIPEYRWWAEDQNTSEEVVVPLGRMGATKYQYFRLGKGTAHHMLIVGTTGSGKTNLLHVLIVGLSLIYHPDELELYLIDFKTIGFPLYAHYKLPHARVVAIQSEREFGLSVLEGLEVELEQRKQLFSKARVQDITQFRRVQPRTRMPRILLVIDEFQELFMRNDEIAKDAAEHLDRFVRTGRGLGIHVVLASQTLAGLSSLERSTILNNSTISQMTVRIAMAMRYEKADSHLILSEDNTAASLLFQFRPGEAIYNADGGAETGNSRFQSFWLSNEELPIYLDAIRQLAQSHNYVPPHIQKIFDGSKNADINENQALQVLLDAATWKPVQTFATIWLGDPTSLKDVTNLQLRPRSGNNLLIIDQNEDGASGLLTIALFSLAAQYSPKAAQFYIIDGRPDTPYVDRLRQREKQIPHVVKIVNWRTLSSHLAEINAEIEKRTETDINQKPPIFLLIYGLQRIRTLRSEEQTPSELTRQFSTLLHNGPEQNIHTLAWCDTLSNFDRSVGNTGLDEFGLRIAFQMSEHDSTRLIGTPASSELSPHRVHLFKEGMGNPEKFIPYESPSDEWLTQAVDRLSQKQQ
jgi:serine/threonine protein kinase